MSRANAIGSPVGGGTSEVENEEAKGSPTAVFRRAVVLEMFHDNSFYSDSQLLDFISKAKNSKILTGNPSYDPKLSPADVLRYLIPINSLLVKDVTSGAAQGDKDADIMICFPFFPPHVQLPVKPGEIVWIMPDGSTEPGTYVYWLCRVSGPGFTDDVNFTHLDRSNLLSPPETKSPGVSERETVGTNLPGTWTLPNGAITNTAYTGSFPNGDGYPNHFTVGDESGTYNNIVLSSSDDGAGASFSPEPVPRLCRRPGDLILQGSNNATILFSDDRGWGSSDRPLNDGDSNAAKSEEEMKRTFAGSIDIVTGRGRWLSAPNENPIDTAPRVVNNSREKLETDKYYVSPTEGDPDFLNDSSRIYVAMNTNGDEKLGLTCPAIDGTDVPEVIDSPYVIVKSDEIRIVARKDSGKEVNGSIKIVKEGDDGKDKAVIVIQPDGSIMIDGPKISIGSGTTDDNQVLIGNDSSADHLLMGETLLEMIKNLEKALNGHIHNSGVGPTAPMESSYQPSGESWDESLSAVGKVK